MKRPPKKAQPLEEMVRDFLLDVEENYKTWNARQRYLVEPELHFMNSGMCVYEFIEACRKNRKTVLVSDILDEVSFVGLLVEATAGIQGEDLIAGKISETVWPPLVQAAARIFEWPGNFISVAFVERETLIALLLDLLDTDCETLILDLPNSDLMASYYADIFKKAVERRKIVIFDRDRFEEQGAED